MSNGMLVRLQPLAAANFLGGSYSSAGINAAFPVGNLASPQPKVVMQTNPNATPWQTVIDIDLGADIEVDTLAVLFTNMAVNSIWKAYGAVGAAGLGAPGTETAGNFRFGFTGWAPFGVAPTTRQTTRHAIAMAAPATFRWLRIYFQDYPADNPEQLTRIGIITVGQSWLCSLPYANFELGSGRKVDDLSIIQELDGGEFAVFKKAKPVEFRATWSNMTDADLRALWSILQEVGESEPILLIEDPDPTTGQQERIHYGLIRSMDFYERQQVDKSRIELRIRGWL